MVEANFSQHAYFARCRKEIKLHAFHNPNYTTREGFGHGTGCLHTRNDHRDPSVDRLKFLYESFPAVTFG